MKKKFKTIVAMALSVVTLATLNPTPVKAFSSDSEGWIVTKTFLGDTIEDVYQYSYNSTGVLTIKATTNSKTLTKVNFFGSTGGTFVNTEYTKGQTGEDVLTIPTASKNTVNAADIKTIIFDGFDTIGSTSSDILGSSLSNLENIVFNDGIKKIQRLANVDNIRKVNKITIPSSVTELGTNVLTGMTTNREAIKIEIPSTVTIIENGAFVVTDTETKFTILCEKGSAAFNYATSKSYNVELYDSTSECVATLDNDITWNIIAPEDITFAYSSEGWVANTWIGIQGNLSPASKLYISTDDSFDIFGETKSDKQTVAVLTEDTNTTLTSNVYKTELNDTKLQSGKVSIPLTEDAYKIEYKCLVSSSTILRQTYKGTVKFIINEVME